MLAPCSKYFATVSNSCLAISTLYATSSVREFELQVKQFNETENTVNAYEQSSEDCNETHYTWNCNEILQKILGRNVANYTAHAQD